MCNRWPLCQSKWYIQLTAVYALHVIYVIAIVYMYIITLHATVHVQVISICCPSVQEIFKMNFNHGRNNHLVCILIQLVHFMSMHDSPSISLVTCDIQTRAHVHAWQNILSLLHTSDSCLMLYVKVKAFVCARGICALKSSNRSHAWHCKHACKYQNSLSIN